MDFTIKQVPALVLLSAHKRLTIPEIPAFAQQVTPQLYAKAHALGLELAGPETYLYHFDKDCSMELDIGLPIKEEAKGSPEPFQFLNAPAFKCVSCVYRGSMKGIGAAWDELTHHCGEKKYKLTPENREVYLKWVAFDSAENETDLQRGVE